MARDCLFPNDTKILIPHRYDETAAAIVATKKAMQNEDITVIFEATFKTKDGLFASVDALQKNDDKTVSIFEFKSTSSLKEEHKLDVAFQYKVVSETQDISEALVVHLDKENGNLKDPISLFNVRNITVYAEEQLDIVDSTLISLRRDMADKEFNPVVVKESKCDKCPMKKKCWGDLPNNSINRVYRLQAPSKRDLTQQGIHLIQDIPEDFKLPKLGSRQRNVEISGESFIDKESLKDDLVNVKYPFYFLDFETVLYTLPIYKNLEPMTQVVTQFSVHKQTKTGKTTHDEWIQSDSKDRREEVAKQLLKACGKRGSILHIINLLKNQGLKN